MVLGSGIRDPGSGKNLFRIPDPGVNKHPIPDPGSRIRIRNTAVDDDYWSNKAATIKQIKSFDKKNYSKSNYYIYYNI